MMSALVALLFRQPLHRILDRLVAPDLASAWLRSLDAGTLPDRDRQLAEHRLVASDIHCPWLGGARRWPTFGHAGARVGLTQSVISVTRLVYQAAS